MEHPDAATTTHINIMAKKYFFKVMNLLFSEVSALRRRSSYKDDGFIWTESPKGGSVLRHSQGCANSRK